MELSLDAAYGCAVPPVKVDAQEGKLAPRSIHVLDAETGALLRQLTELALRKLGVAAYVYCEMPILWIVNEDGSILFAIEEVVNELTLDYALPRLRNAKVEPGFARLGHPSLVEAKPARIAGEIIFDVRAEQPKWYITNGSGRYGIGHDRRIEHLETVRECFRKHGIELEPFFIQPKGRLG